MARAMFESFMPDSHGLLQHYPGLYNQLLPEECNEGQQPVSLHPFLAFPALLPLAAAGSVIGFWGYNKLGPACSVFYRRALLFFGCMNIAGAAIACHCFTPPSSPVKPLMIALDVAFTCCSASCLFLGALFNASSATTRATSGSCPQEKNNNSNMHELWANLLLSVVLIVAIAGNYCRVVPFLNEVLYIYTTTAAAGMVWAKEGMRQDLSGQQKQALYAAASCYALFFPVGCLLSRHLCHLPGHIDVMNILFLFCDIAFWFLLKYLMLHQQARHVNEQAGVAKAAAAVSNNSSGVRAARHQPHHFKVARWME